MTRKMHLEPIFNPALRYTIPEACSLLRTSRATIYKIIAAGELRVLREGKRTYVPGSEIARRSALPA